MPWCSSFRGVEFVGEDCQLVAIEQDGHLDMLRVASRLPVIVGSERFRVWQIFSLRLQASSCVSAWTTWVPFRAKAGQRMCLAFLTVQSTQKFFKREVRKIKLWDYLLTGAITSRQQWESSTRTTHHHQNRNWQVSISEKRERRWSTMARD